MPVTAPDHRTAVAAVRRERMRRRLLEAGAGLVAAGTTAPTIEELLAVAGVSRGSFYRYYPDARTLVDDLGRAVADEVVALLAPVVQGRDDPAEQVAAGLLALTRLARRVPALGALLAVQGQVWAAGDGEGAGVHPVHRGVADTLRAGLEQGRFQDVDLPGAQQVLTAMALAGAARATRPGGAPPAWPRLLTAAALRALGVAPATAAALAAQPAEAVALPEGGLLAALRDARPQARRGTG